MSNPLLTMIDAGAEGYKRERDLPKLMGRMPDDTSAIVRVLAKALTDYLVLGIRRHWSYDLNRHIAIASALKAERARLVREMADGA